MMILNYPITVLSLLVLLASLTTILYSCKKNKQIKEKTSIVSQKMTEQELYKYNEKDLFKTLNIIFNKKELSVLFLINETGNLGDFGYEKNINIVILDEGILFDRIEFSNASILCDVGIITQSIKKVVFEDNLSENLIFSIIESCDGEEPDILQTILWNGKKQNYNIEVPKYFENNLKEREFVNNVLKNNDTINSSIKKIILKSVRLLLKDR